LWAGIWGKGESLDLACVIAKQTTFFSALHFAGGLLVLPVACKSSSTGMTYDLCHPLSLQTPAQEANYR